MSLLFYFKWVNKYFKFSLLISNVAKNDTYILHKDKFSGNIFKNL